MTQYAKATQCALLIFTQKYRDKKMKVLTNFKVSMVYHVDNCSKMGLYIRMYIANKILAFYMKTFIARQGPCARKGPFKSLFKKQPLLHKAPLLDKAPLQDTAP